MDADHGYNQIEVEAGEAVDATAFELFNGLWCSNRVLLGMKNGPATFKRNTVVMQGPLLHKKTKSYFDDMFGKALQGDYVALRVVWRLLLRLRHHGWKCNLRRTFWGYERIESVGFIWSAEGIAVANKNVDAMKAMKLPQCLAELRTFLGLANQFRERVPGFTLLVANLTAQTRGSSKSSRLILTPKATIEFENMKAILASPAVLQQFRYNRKTIVYTDALVGTQDGLMAGGLGVP